MYTVTQRVKQMKQPRGGFIKSKDYEKKSFSTGIEALHPKENISPGVIGTTVDLMTRFLTGKSKYDAFITCMKGAWNILEIEVAEKLLEDIRGLDDHSIIAATRLSSFDVFYRTPDYISIRPIESIIPDQDTIENVRIMIKRSVDFLELYGPKVMDGFSFPHGFSKVIVNGEADYLTTDTLWDLKTSKRGPNKDHWLQLLIYWRMGLHSIYKDNFVKVKYIGIYNPRLDCVYRYELKKLQKDFLEYLDKTVIGYEA